MYYFTRTPWWLKKLYPSRVWHVATSEKIIYLTFDDGPHPVATPFVLDELNRYQAKATFFCIGKNVVSHPGIYQRIIDEGHRVGNHTHHHRDGWRTPNKNYLSDISEAAHHIKSDLFRPPYGKIRSSQVKEIRSSEKYGLSKIVMWDVLSADFDEQVTREQCLKNVINYAGPGSIVVFHDSQKAFPRLSYVLREVLSFYSTRGYVFGVL